MCINIKTWVAVHKALKLNLQIELTQEHLPQSAEDGESLLPAADPEICLILPLSCSYPSTGPDSPPPPFLALFIYLKERELGGVCLKKTSH